jgi:hypothetical protein
MNTSNLTDRNTSQHRVAIIGGGVAGLSCAINLAIGGMQVTVFEAAPHLGGRARIVPQSRFDDGHCLDNGPHMMLGAYQAFYRFLVTVHRLADPLMFKANEDLILSRILYRAPFSWQSESLKITMGEGNLMVAWWQTLRQTKGIRREDILPLLRLAWDVVRNHSAEITVAQWLEELKMSPRLIRELWQPLTLSVMNTSMDTAHSRLMIEVLRRVFLRDSHAWQMAWAKVDFATLYIKPATSALHALGAKLYNSQRIAGLIKTESGWTLIPHHAPKVNGAYLQGFDSVVIATPLWETPALIEQIAGIKDSPLSTGEKNLSLLHRLLAHGKQSDNRPIANVYVQTPVPSAHITEAANRLIDEVRALPILQLQWFEGVMIVWLNHTLVNPERWFVGEEARQSTPENTIAPPLLTAIYSAHVPDNILLFTRQALHSHLQQSIQHSMKAATFKPADDSQEIINLCAQLKLRVIHEKRATPVMDVAYSRRLSAKEAGALSATEPYDSPASTLWVTGDYLDSTLPATLETAAALGEQTAQAILQSLSTSLQ